MNFETHQLTAPLAPFVESIFHYSGFKPDHSIERVVPTGHVFLIFEFDGLERQLYDNDTLQPIQQFRRAWISGMQKHFISISAHDDSEMFVIQFKAGGAHPFLHFPLHEITDRVVAGDSVLDGALFDLQSVLQGAETSSDKFQLAEEWLLQRFDTALTPSEALLQVVTELQSQPASRLSEVVENFPGAQKTLIDQFHKFVGLTPKTYQRILRFNEIFAEANN